MAKYKFTDKNHSEGGVLSCIMGLASIVVLGGAVYISFNNNGEASAIVGDMALASFLLSFFGLVIGLVSYKEQDKYYLFSHIGSLCCGIMAILLVLIFLMGM